MLESFFTSLLTSVITLSLAWLFFRAPAAPQDAKERDSSREEKSSFKGYDEPRDNRNRRGTRSSFDQESNGLRNRHRENSAAEGGGRNRQDRAFLTPGSVEHIDSIRRSFSRDKPPHLEGNSRGSRGNGTSNRASANHAKSNGLWCEPCGREFIESTALLQHQVAKHHPKAALPSDFKYGEFPCDLCLKVSRTQIASRQHTSLAHPWSLVCAECRVSFTSVEEAKQHYTSQGHSGKRSVAHRLPIQLAQPRNISQPRLLQNDNAYKPYEGFEPDRNLPELQHTFGCSKCSERFTSAEERDYHLTDIFAHGEPNDLEAAFPPLPSRNQSRQPSPEKPDPSPVIRPSLTIAITEPEIENSHSAIALDQPLPSFELDFSANSSPSITPSQSISLIAEGDESSESDTALSLDPTPQSWTSEAETENSKDIEEGPDSASITTPASVYSDTPWDEPESLPSGSQVHPDAKIQWGEYYETPVPGPEEFPPLAGLKEPIELERPSWVESPTKTDQSEKEEEEEVSTPAEDDMLSTYSPVQVVSPSTALSSPTSRWSVGEKPSFALPDLTPRMRSLQTLEALRSIEHKSPEATSEEVGDQYGDWQEEEQEDRYVAPLHITGSNNIPVGTGRSGKKRYSLERSSDYANASQKQAVYHRDSGPAAVTLTLTPEDDQDTNHSNSYEQQDKSASRSYGSSGAENRAIPMNGSIEEFIPSFDGRSSPYGYNHGQNHGEYPNTSIPPGLKPAPPRATLSAWSSPKRINPSSSTAYDPEHPRVWGSADPSSSSDTDGITPRKSYAAAGSAGASSTPRGWNNNTASTSSAGRDSSSRYESEWSKSENNASSNKRSNRQTRQTFAQRAAAAAKKANEPVIDEHGFSSTPIAPVVKSRGGYLAKKREPAQPPPVPQVWSMQGGQYVASSGSSTTAGQAGDEDDEDMYGGW